ncbi:hypothetical protein [uncultured Bacteroides sp.]|uniref:NigD1/NigD2 family lipoprotein n=1 Tax=uncultured Bacteroides sp. TaxID=162156 RepID=UPI002AA893DC|nr:hypothetical protein [uncultured Bacteroides sp.]
MKKIKLVALALTLLVGISFTSCMNSDDNNSYDGYAFATVSQGYLGSPVLIADNGWTLNPTNPSALLLSDGSSYPERVLIYYKYVEGETVQDGKTDYDITIVSGGGIYTKAFNSKPDTLVNDYSVTDIAPWIDVNRKYLTVSFLVNYSSNVDFDMYQQKVGNDTLYVKFNYSKGGSDNAYNNYQDYISFKMPSYIEGITPKNDSIWVKVSAKGTSGSTIVKNIQCKYDY